MIMYSRLCGLPFAIAAGCWELLSSFRDRGTRREASIQNGRGSLSGMLREQKGEGSTVVSRSSSKVVCRLK